MINNLIVEITKIIPDPYMFESIPDIYGKNYMVYWKDGVIKLYKDSHKEENLLTIVNPLYFNDVFERYLLDLNILQLHLEHMLLLYSHVHKETSLKVTRCLGAEKVKKFEESMDSFGKKLTNSVEKFLNTPKLKVVKE